MSNINTVVIKASLNEDVRRFTLSSPFTYVRLVEQLYQAYDAKLKTYTTKQTFVIKYRDDENDLITLSNDVELEDAVLIASSLNPKILKLVVDVHTAPAPTPTPAINEEQAALDDRGKM